MAFGLGFILDPSSAENWPTLPCFLGSAPPLPFGLPRCCLSAASPSSPSYLKKPSKQNPISPFTRSWVSAIAKAFQMHNLKIIFLVIFLHTLGFCFYTQFMPVFWCKIRFQRRGHRHPFCLHRTLDRPHPRTFS